MTAEFQLVEPRPIILDRETLNALETQRQREDERRSDEFLAALLARRNGQHVVRTV